MQVKTNDYEVPYKPNEGDQTISKKNVQKGNQQLLSDILRFLELFRDIKVRENIQTSWG